MEAGVYYSRADSRAHVFLFTSFFFFFSLYRSSPTVRFSWRTRRSIDFPVAEEASWSSLAFRLLPHEYPLVCSRRRDNRGALNRIGYSGSDATTSGIARTQSVRASARWTLPFVYVYVSSSTIYILPRGRGAHGDGEIVGHALPLARFRIVKRREIVNVANEFGRWPRVTPGRETIFSEAEPGSD